MPHLVVGAAHILSVRTVGYARAEVRHFPTDTSILLPYLPLLFLHRAFTNSYFTADSGTALFPYTHHIMHSMFFTQPSRVCWARGAHFREQKLGKELIIVDVSCAGPIIQVGGGTASPPGLTRKIRH
jgi:hypothetical protein